MDTGFGKLNGRLPPGTKYQIKELMLKKRAGANLDLSGVFTKSGYLYGFQAGKNYNNFLKCKCNLYSVLPCL